VLAVLVILLAVGVVYVQALGGPFLWDDRLLVLDAPLVEKTNALGDYFRHPFWMGAGAQPHDLTYYRPLVTLSFALDHRLHGNNPGGFHLTNLGLHLTCAFLLYACLRRARVREAVAALVTTAWALQPRLAEAAAWISGRTDLLATLFVLAALVVWGQSWSRRVAAALCFGLGLFAKESALALPCALAAGEWLREPPGARSLRRVALRLAPFAGVFAAYVALRLIVVGFKDAMPPLGAAQRTLVVLQTVGTYALALIDPLRPRAVIGRVGALSVPHIALGVVALAALALAAVRLRRRLTAESATGLTLAAFSLLPVLHLVSIPLRTLAADRFLYLPTAGLALAAAPGLDGLLGAVRARWAAALVAVVTLGVAAFVRVGVWSDEVEFWARTYLETPRTNNTAVTELFGVYYRAGLYADGLALAERGMTYDDPNRRDAAYNAALVLERLGHWDAASARFRSFRPRRPGDHEAHVELALIGILTGRDEETATLLERLARAGDPRGAALLARLPELSKARGELVREGATAPAERRARLASMLGADALATRAWGEVVRAPATPRDVLVDGLRYLVQTGDGAAIEAAARAHLRRFGPLEPKLAAMIDVRLAELERLAALRPRVGLVAPAAPTPSSSAPR